MLPRNALVRQVGIKPCGNRFLRISLDRPLHTEFIAAGAFLAFANHCQRGLGWRRVHQFDLRLVAHRLDQLLLQRRHIDNPGQCVLRDAVGGEVNLAAIVAPDLHFPDRRGKRRIGPDPQRLQYLTRRAVQGIGAHIGCGQLAFGLLWPADQRHAQALARQQQRQGTADHAVAANTDIKGFGHAPF